MSIFSQFGSKLCCATVWAVLAINCSPALAWGEAGHRITGHIAERLLTADAKARVRAIMGGTDLSSISLYMDRNKTDLAKRIPGSREWHYDDRPICDKTATKLSYCPNGNCASVQITRHYRALIDSHSTLDERRFAIQVLVHLIGDIHQPLHASDHQDRGGNDIRVSFLLPSGEIKKTDLHSAWDSDFVRIAFDTADERVIAKRLVDGVTTERLKGWQKGNTNAWLADSYKLAAELTYGLLPGFNNCQNDDFDTNRLELDAAYVERARALVPEQLLMGGARIAYILNRAFASD
jgi:S1/P1 Nuclease